MLYRNVWQLVETAVTNLVLLPTLPTIEVDNRFRWKETFSRVYWASYVHPMTQYISLPCHVLSCLMWSLTFQHVGKIKAISLGAASGWYSSCLGVRSIQTEKIIYTDNLQHALEWNAGFPTWRMEWIFLNIPRHVPEWYPLSNPFNYCTLFLRERCLCWLEPLFLYLALHTKNVGHFQSESARDPFQ